MTSSPHIDKSRILAQPPVDRPPRRFASMRTITALMLREMATSYGRSPGGYIWAILEPVAGIALLTGVFAMTFAHPALGINFALFYATGMVPYSIFSGVSSKLAQSINYSKPLLAYPSVTFMDAILGRFLINMLTEIMVAYIIIGGILMLFETRTILDIPSIAQAIGLSAALALGVGTLNCFLTTRFPIWQQAWSIFMRPMFVLSCVFLMFDSLPYIARVWLWYNPLIHVIGLMRRGFYTGYDAAYASPMYVLGFSAVCFVAGVILLRRYQYVLLHL
jgi:capsular polysaccharide transport system permease protein